MKYHVEIGTINDYFKYEIDVSYPRHDAINALNFTSLKVDRLESMI